MRNRGCCHRHRDWRLRFRLQGIRFSSRPGRADPARDRQNKPAGQVVRSVSDEERLAAAVGQFAGHPHRSGTESEYILLVFTSLAIKLILFPTSFAHRMKSVNVRWEDDLIRFDCPHCGVDGEVDEATLRAVWAMDGKGVVTCPVPNGCQAEYILPTLEELEAHMVSVQNSSSDHPIAPELEPPSSEPAVAAAPVVKSEIIIKRHANPVSHPPRPQTGHGHTKMAIRTFRHMDYKQSGQDIFDQSVSEFLEHQGSANIVSVSPITYMDRDDKLVDYGVLVVYHKSAEPVAAPAEKQEWRD